VNATNPTNKAFAGIVDTSGSYQMTGNFWDNETSGQVSTAGNATGKTTISMKTQSTFTNANWNFDTIWRMANGMTYPLLRWQSFPSLPLFTTNLTAGWNLISIPLETSECSLEIVLSSITGKWDVAKYYDGLSKTWKSYRVGGTQTFNNLDRTMGIWLHATENCMLAVSGVIPTSTTITLHAGWNLVAYPTLAEKTVAMSLWGTSADRVEVHDPASPYLISEAGSNYVMKPGEGYWVRVPADTMWVVDW
jgi:hypothetical protein